VVAWILMEEAQSVHQDLDGAKHGRMDQVRRRLRGLLAHLEGQDEERCDAPKAQERLKQQRDLVATGYSRSVVSWILAERNLARLGYGDKHL